MYYRTNLTFMMAIIVIAFCIVLPASRPGHASARFDTCQGTGDSGTGCSSSGCRNAGTAGSHHDCCCETGCTCLGTPSSHDSLFDYVPLVSRLAFRDPSWYLPQVYRPIFVPPQNWG